MVNTCCLYETTQARRSQTAGERRQRMPTATALSDSDHLPDREAKVPGGTISYREAGSGPPLIFIHGLLVNGLLWRKVVPELQDRYRCIVPEMPLGSHRVPMDASADLSPAGLAR